MGPTLIFDEQLCYGDRCHRNGLESPNVDFLQVPRSRLLFHLHAQSKPQRASSEETEALAATVDSSHPYTRCVTDLVLETERLFIRDAQGDDLDSLLQVFLSNPEYLGWTEGSADEPGRYDLPMLQRDWTIATMTPGRHFLGVFDKANREAVGVADFLEEHPDHGIPWIGLIEIRGDRHRQGLGREIIDRLLQHFQQDRGRSEAGAGVLVRNGSGLAFLRAMGFLESGGGQHHGPLGVEPVILFRRKLEE